MNTRFCIKHQKEVELEIFGGAEGHVAALFDPDWGWCEGPLTFSEPPELEENWELNLDAPSPDELAEMEVLADELLTDVWEGLSEEEKYL